MALEGPQLRYARVDDVQGENKQVDDTLVKALDLARKLEELLEDTRSRAVIAVNDPSTHGARMARAMASSLVDELEALVNPSRKTGTRGS